MKARIKIAAAAILAVAGMAALPGVASAGTWHVNAASCPDLREDRADAYRNTGRGDVREDIRDRQVISCPAHAWRYVPDRYERIALQRVAAPLTVYRDRAGGYYARNRHGAAYRVDIVIDYPRGIARPHRSRGHPRRH